MVKSKIIRNTGKYNFLKIDPVKSLGTALIIFFIILSFTTDNFFTLFNLITILRQCSLYSILAIGLGMVILTGGIDLSGANVISFTGITVAWMIATVHLDLWLAIILTLLIGAIIGLVNGLLIAYLGITPFAATIATMFIIQGITFQLTDGYPIYAGLTEEFKFIGQGYIWIIPVPAIITTFIFCIAYFFLNNIRTGQHIYAIGSNEEAAVFTGVNVKRTKLIAYIISSTCAALDGIMLTARLGTAQPAAAGFDFFFTAITAVVIGGVSLSGGKGSIIGILIGVLFLAIMNNGLTLLKVSSYMQWIAIGFLLILSLLWNSYKGKYSGGEFE